MTIKNPEFPEPENETLPAELSEDLAEPLAGEGITEAAGVPGDEETARIVQPEPVDE